MGRKKRFVIVGDPIPQHRPRYSRARISKKGKLIQARVYSDQNDEAKEWRTLLKKEFRGWEPIEGPVSLICRFVFRRPKSHLGTGRNEGKLRPSAPPAHTVKPDRTNLEKWIEDCLKGIAWKDDSQVVVGYSVKRWAAIGEAPHTAVEIEELDTVFE